MPGPRDHRGAVGRANRPPGVATTAAASAAGRSAAHTRPSARRPARAAGAAERTSASDLPHVIPAHAVTRPAPWSSPVIRPASASRPARAGWARAAVAGQREHDPSRRRQPRDVARAHQPRDQPQLRAVSRPAARRRPATRRRATGRASAALARRAQAAERAAGRGGDRAPLSGSRPPARPAARRAPAWARNTRAAASACSIRGGRRRAARSGGRPRSARFAQRKAQADVAAAEPGPAGAVVQANRNRPGRPASARSARIARSRAHRAAQVRRPASPASGLAAMLRARSCAGEGSSPAAAARSASLVGRPGAEPADLHVAAGGQVDVPVAEPAGQGGQRPAAGRRWRSRPAAGSGPRARRAPDAGRGCPGRRPQPSRPPRPRVAQEGRGFAHPDRHGTAAYRWPRCVRRVRATTAWPTAGPSPEKVITAATAE